MNKHDVRVPQGNSAHRHMIERRQENRRFAVVGFVVAILMMSYIIHDIFRSESHDIPADSSNVTEMPIDQAESVHPLVQYARGVPSVEEMDAMINESSSDR